MELGMSHYINLQIDRFARFNSILVRVSAGCLAVAAISGCTISPPVGHEGLQTGHSPSTSVDVEPSANSELILLGTAGGPLSRGSMSQPGSVLMVNGKGYLVDVGDGTAKRLTEAGIALPQLHRIFLTHLHGDHVIGLGPLMMFHWVLGSDSQITVSGPPGTQRFVESAHAYVDTPIEIFRPQYPPRPQVNEVFVPEEPQVASGDGPTLIYSDRNVRVYAVENTHYATLRRETPAYGRDRSYSYRFETTDRSIVFSGDTGPSEALANLAKDADILVTEIIDLQLQLEELRAIPDTTEKQLSNLIAHMEEEHLTADQIGKLATRAQVKTVVLNHIVPSNASSEQVARMVATIRRHFEGEVIVGQDLNRF